MPIGTSRLFAVLHVTLSAQSPGAGYSDLHPGALSTAGPTGTIYGPKPEPVSANVKPGHFRAGISNISRNCEKICITRVRKPGSLCVARFALKPENHGQGTKLKKLFVGNLPWSATEGDVASLFADLGEVLSSAA